MLLRIGQRQRRAPRAAEHLPCLNAEMDPQGFHVGHQMPGGVLAQFRVRRGLPAAPLVKEDDAVKLGIMQAAQERRNAPARPAMQHDHGLALRVAAFLVIDFMELRDAKPAAGIGLQFRIEFPHVRASGNAR